MGIYQTTVDSIQQQQKSFFNTMLDCVDSLCKEGSLARFHLSPPIDPVKEKEAYYNGEAHQRDFLLLHQGKPLVAVFMRYTFSGGPIFLPSSDSAKVYKKQVAPAVPPVAEMRAGLAERIRAAIPKEEPKELPKPDFIEGSWLLMFRIPGQESPELFEGRPMNLDGLDAAFSRLVDIIVAHIPEKA